MLNPSALTGNVLNVVPLDDQGYSANDVLYCAGHVPTAVGRVLYSGGSRYENLGEPTEIESGINYARLYDATENRLIRIDAPMTGGPTGEEGVRWYPTNTRLADSRVLVTGGFTRCCGFDFANLSLELFDYLAYTNGAPPWQVLVSHDEGLSDVAPGPLDYTHVYLLPNAVPAARGDHFDRQVAMIGGSGNVLLFNYADDLSARERFAEPPNGRRGWAQAGPEAIPGLDEPRACKWNTIRAAARLCRSTALTATPPNPTQHRYIARAAGALSAPLT